MKAHQPTAKRMSAPIVRKAQFGTSALQTMADQSPASQNLTALQRMADARHPVQRMEEDELQMKPIQRMEEDELQGKFIQRAEARKANNTGLPDNLKAGIENLSGMSMDHVKVHRNSDKPAAVQAHAYAQGSDIHLGPGQEKHLPHEAWHVVQQAQGRVKPTMQLKGVAVNDDAGLEKEADVMGARSLQMQTAAYPVRSLEMSYGMTIQRQVIPTRSAQSSESEDVLKAHYNAAWDHLWGSDTAKKIYKFVNDLTAETVIEVGSSNSDAEPGKVRWNPHEKNVLLNKEQAEIGVGEGGTISDDDIVGQSSAATTLIHELGHIRQHHEANALIEEIKGRHAKIATTKIPNLAELLMLVDQQAKDAGVNEGAESPTLVMEDDNVTRHERPVATELGEARRNNYKSGMGNAEEYSQYFSTEAWETVQSLQQGPHLAWIYVGEVDKGAEKSRTAVTYITSKLAKMQAAADLIPVGNWKRKNALAALAIVSDILDQLEATETVWAETLVDQGLAKPKW